MVRSLLPAIVAAILAGTSANAQVVYYLALGVGTNDCADFLTEVDRLAAGQPARRHEAYAAWIAGYIAGGLRDRPERVSLAGGLGADVIVARIVATCRETPKQRFSAGVEAALKVLLAAPR